MDAPTTPSRSTVHTGQSEPNVGRRRLLEATVLTVTGALGLTLIGTGGRFLIGDALEEPAAQWVNVGEVATLPPGQVHRVTYTQRRKDAWRTSEASGLLYCFSSDGTTYTALSGICTHLGCNVHWKEENVAFHCPCHEAKFSQAGEVISGPPRRALRLLKTKIENGQLSVLV